MIEGLVTLCLSAVLMVAVRLQLMGSKAPEFAPADNPSADCPSRLTRALTFLYLPAFNAWLLLQPSVLSFDWSMEAIPLVHSFADPRNLATAALYVVVLYAVWCALFKRRDDEAPSRRPSNNELDTLFPLPVLAAGYGAEDQNNGNGSDTGCCYKYGCASGDCGTGGGSSSSSSSSVRSDSSSVDGNASGRTRRTSATDLTVIALAMLVIPFVPATNLFFYVGFVVAERVLYIPSMGYCLLVAMGCHLVDEALRKRWRRCKHDEPNKKRQARLLRVAFRLGVAALLVVFAARTVQRNEDWLSEETLYRSGIRVNPPKGEQRRLFFLNFAPRTSF